MAFLYGLTLFNQSYTRTAPCHCERSVAISRKRNAAHIYAPANSRTRLKSCLCEERNARRGNLPEGKTDKAYTNGIPLSRGISPLRSDYRPHSGRNDIINQTYTLSFRACATVYFKCARRFIRSNIIQSIGHVVIASVVEKSPAVETETPVHDHSNTCPQGLPAASLPASGGSPPYTTIQILARRGSLPPAHSPAQALRP